MKIAVVACAAILCVAAAPPSPMASPPAASGTANGIADQIAAGLPALAGDVAVHVRAGDPRAAKLADVIEGLLVERVGNGHGAKSVTRFAGDAAAARLAGFAWWIDGEIVVDGGEVAVLGRAVHCAHDLWAETVGHASVLEVAQAPFARAPLDAEMRAYLGVPVSPSTLPVLTHVPRPRRYAFHALKLPLDLGAPVIGLAAGDLDGDGRAELVALTVDEVVWLELGREGPRVRQRIPLEGPAPTGRPRDPVGGITIADVDGDGRREVLARSSAHSGALILGWKDGVLVKRGVPRDVPMCAAVDEAGVVHVLAAPLVAARDVFDRAGMSSSPPWVTVPMLPERFLAVACSASPPVVGAVDETGTLSLFRPGVHGAWTKVSGVGTAFVLADLDGDGLLEVVSATARVPGLGDSMTVQQISADGTTHVLHRSLALSGGVAAMAAGDFDGSGTIEVVAVVRAWGQSRSELWVLE